MTPLARHHDVSGTTEFSCRVGQGRCQSHGTSRRTSSVKNSCLTVCQFRDPRCGSHGQRRRNLRQYDRTFSAPLFRDRSSCRPQDHQEGLTHYQRENEPHTRRDRYSLQRVAPDRQDHIVVHGIDDVGGGGASRVRNARWQFRRIVLLLLSRVIVVLRVKTPGSAA
jgi:hypothetical protein